MMEKNHVEQIKKKLKGNRKWTTIKETKESNKIPTRIYDQDNDITSPKILANLFNNYFNDKIKKIREKFSNNNKMAIRILENLVEKPKSVFNFKPTNVYTVYETIQKAKNSKSSGCDSVTMSILKDCPQTAARIICHIFNNMIRTGIYPEKLKTSKVIPILKNGKPATDKSSYRPHMYPTHCR